VRQWWTELSELEKDELLQEAAELLRSHGCDHKGDLHVDVKQWLKDAGIEK
jgi:hypothetical protein